MSEYTTREVAELLGLTQARVRRLARSARLHPERKSGARYRFRFRDLVLLRTALALEREGVPSRRVLRTMRRLHSQLPLGRPLTAIRILPEGAELVAEDGEVRWQPESGQVRMWLNAGEESASRPRDTEAEGRRRARAEAKPRKLAAGEWYDLGCALQESSPLQAEEAFRRAVEVDPGHADAHVNLGVLLHDRGDVAGAEMRYRLALQAAPRSGTAAFDLGVALEDQGRNEEAADAYRRAIASEDPPPDAYYNLSRLCEQEGDRAAALRYLREYSGRART